MWSILIKLNKKRDRKRSTLIENRSILDQNCDRRLGIGFVNRHPNLESEFESTMTIQFEMANCLSLVAWLNLVVIPVQIFFTGNFIFVHSTKWDLSSYYQVSCS